MLLHADSITQNGAAAEGAARVDRHDAEAVSAGAVLRDQTVHQAALAGAGRPRDADDGGPAGTAKHLRQDPFAAGRALLHQRDRPRQGHGVSRHDRARQILHQDARSGVSPSSCRAMTRRWISEVPSPMVQILASR